MYINIRNADLDDWIEFLYHTNPSCLAIDRPNYVLFYRIAHTNIRIRTVVVPVICCSYFLCKALPVDVCHLFCRIEKMHGSRGWLRFTTEGNTVVYRKHPSLLWAQHTRQTFVVCSVKFHSSVTTRLFWQHHDNCTTQDKNNIITQLCRPKRRG
jgi:hypothetical protein